MPKQKKKPKKRPRKLLTVPTKTKPRRPMPKIGVDASYESNVAGRALQALGTLKKGGLTLGLGGGAVDFSYLNKQVYGLASVDLITNIGKRGEFYSRTTYADFPKTRDTVKQRFLGFRLGTSWDLFRGRKTTFRLGGEFAGKVATSLRAFNQAFGTVGGGASILHGPFAVYATGYASLAPETPIQQRWTDVFRLWSPTIRVGTMVNDVLGSSRIGVSLEHGRFHKGAGAQYNIGNFKFSADFRKESDPFGRGTIFGIGVQIPLGGTSKAKIIHDVSHVCFGVPCD